ncbi:aminotransferase DegT [Lysinibacillus sp. PLM2]|nr:aminotransferase DegT [Lysinibacillus sp. PLM2]
MMKKENPGNWNSHTPIPHNRPTLGKAEALAAINILRSGWVAQGKTVEAFEEELCDFLGLPNGCAVAVSSGTAALYLSLLFLGAKDKNVAFPTYTCSALRNASTLARAKSFLVDSQINSPNIDIELIDKNVDIAIVPHMFGIPQIIYPKHKSIRIIEDCAQSLGAKVKGSNVGIQGDVGVFSFYATKLITSGGQGGMIVSKDSTLIQEIKDYRLFDRRSDSKIRFNFQMTDLQAAIGTTQLRQLPQFIARREEIFEQYCSAGLPLIDGPPNTKAVRFRAILNTSKQDEVISALQNNNITAVIPIKESELIESLDKYQNALYWTKNTVSLPIYPTLKDNDVKRIIEVVKNTL